jgi:hypothetical protein
MLTIYDIEQVYGKKRMEMEQNIDDISGDIPNQKPKTSRMAVASRRCPIHSWRLKKAMATPA